MWTGHRFHPRRIGELPPEPSAIVEVVKIIAGKTRLEWEDSVEPVVIVICQPGEGKTAVPAVVDREEMVEEGMVEVVVVKGMMREMAVPVVVVSDRLMGPEQRKKTRRQLLMLVVSLLLLAIALALALMVVLHFTP